MRTPWLLLLLALPVAAATVAPARDELWLARGDMLWQINTDGHSSSQALPAGLQTPLGSTWKLWIYLYVQARHIQTSDYQCHGQNKEETFCCTPGASIDLDRALAQSCGLYFAPQRLGIRSQDWRQFWQQQAAPHWLLDLQALQPATVVPVRDLLAALRASPPLAAVQAQAALQGVTVDGRAAGAVRYFGSTLRVKTWTWDDTQRPGHSMGGIAGWQGDGQVLWAAAQGGGGTILQRWAPALAAQLPATNSSELGSACVVSELFQRYPIAEVYTGDGQVAAAGQLQGRYRVQFQRGTTANIVSNGEIVLRRDGAIQLQGHFALNDYVARVLEREGAVTPLEAARALAIAIRSYAAQSSHHEDGCYVLPDSSSTQRLLPRPPSATASAIARWSDGLILVGVPIAYHEQNGGNNRLSWQAAVQAAAMGRHFDDILHDAFPQGRLLSLYAAEEDACQPLPTASAWLAQQSRLWQRQLQAETGFEMPASMQLCQLSHGLPHTDLHRQRIYLPGFGTQEQRLTLTHEWLHLAFEHHARGRDEAYIETLARQLENSGGNPL